MSLKILMLDGLTDQKLCRLIEELMTTIPGVSTAKINFLTQNLSLQIDDGSDVSEVARQAALEIQKNVPGVSVKLVDVAKIPEKTRAETLGQPAKTSDYDEDEAYEYDEDEDKESAERDENSAESRAGETDGGFANHLPFRFSELITLQTGAYFASAVLLLLGRTAPLARFAGGLNVLAYLCGLLSLFAPVRRAWYRTNSAACALAGLCTGALFFIDTPVAAVCVLLILRAGFFLAELIYLQTELAVGRDAGFCPAQANLMSGTVPVQVPSSLVSAGDEVFVLAGDRIGFDGVVKEGRSRVRAALSGQVSQVSQGDAVRCGDRCLDGPLAIAVTQEQAASLSALVGDSVRSALNDNTESAELCRQARRQSMLFGFFLTAAILIALFALIFTSNQISQWMPFFFTALLTVAPCGLSTAVRAGYAAALIRALKQGILVQGTKGLDVLSKTGNMIIMGFSRLFAQGEYRLVSVKPAEGIEADELFQIAAQIESASNHPIAKAICGAYEEHTGKKAGLPQDVRIAEPIHGYGVRAMIGKRIVLVGNEALMRDAGVTVPAPISGETAVYVSVSFEYVGAICFENALRPGVHAIGSALREAGVSHTFLISGCSESVLSEAKRELAVDEVHCAPTNTVKRNTLSTLAERETQGNLTALAGPLERLDLFPGRCCRIALESNANCASFLFCDAVVPAGTPEKLPEVILLGKRLHALASLGAVLAATVKIVLLLLVVAGQISVYGAAFAVAALSVLMAILSEIWFL